MNQTTTNNLMLIGLILMLAMMSFCSYQFVQMRDEFHNPSPTIETHNMQTMSTDVVNETTGFTTTVKTTRNEDESTADFKARHLEMCNEMKNSDTEPPK